MIFAALMLVLAPVSNAPDADAEALADAAMADAEANMEAVAEEVEADALPHPPAVELADVLEDCVNTWVVRTWRQEQDSAVTLADAALRLCHEEAAALHESGVTIDGNEVSASLARALLADVRSRAIASVIALRWRFKN